MIHRLPGKAQGAVSPMIAQNAPAISHLIGGSVKSQRKGLRGAVAACPGVQGTVAQGHTARFQVVARRPFNEGKAMQGLAVIL
ncbi:hypothetical protein HX875_03510 [Pseudomonas yamanorum]|uniref:hypothetical protein n=1 Tax=Pseudomonas yamanorum TaxID=515393 RepID=UPI0015A4D9C6|nr:hypothetical protein [Pseudomonas yamanorum]NWE38525.1 hypothetical protein [Pseudomonas yamanorum]